MDLFIEFLKVIFCLILLVSVKFAPGIKIHVYASLWSAGVAIYRLREARFPYFHFKSFLLPSIEVWFPKISDGVTNFVLINIIYKTHEKSLFMQPFFSAISVFFLPS